MESIIAALVGHPVKGTYTDGAGQPATIKGRLRAIDDQGFTVIEVSNGKCILIPKDKFIIIEELSEDEYAESLG
jgi:hypothetical protein